MVINIEFYYIVNDCKSMRKADFPVNMRSFKEDPNKEAARIAYGWYKQIKKDHAYEISIQIVIYNGENDITELVKQLDEPPDWFIMPSHH